MPDVSYPAFFNMVRVRYVELGLDLSLILGLDVSV